MEKDHGIRFTDAIKQLNVFYTTLNNIIVPLFEEGSEHNVICYYVKGEMVD